MTNQPLSKLQKHILTLAEQKEYVPLYRRAAKLVRLYSESNDDQSEPVRFHES